MIRNLILFVLSGANVHRSKEIGIFFQFFRCIDDLSRIFYTGARYMRVCYLGVRYIAVLPNLTPVRRTTVGNRKLRKICELVCSPSHIMFTCLWSALSDLVHVSRLPISSPSPTRDVAIVHEHGTSPQSLSGLHCGRSRMKRQGC